jgi:hypothetical protein
MATQAAGNALQQQALQSSLANVQQGYGASNAMNQLLGTGMSLKYPPLGQASFGGGFGGSGGGFSSKESQSGPAGYGYGIAAPGVKGGYVPDELSPTQGKAVDDVKANLTSGEFIIPKDVVEFKGKEFFYKLMANARRLRATSGNGEPDADDRPVLGYGAG